MIHWKITEDKIAEPDAKAGTNLNALGVTNRGFDASVKLPVKFRMLDDDGEVYYKGVMSEAEFDPLLNFGMPNAGCTELQYKEPGDKEWRVL